LERILYEVEVKLTLTRKQLYRTVIKMLRDKKVFLALTLVVAVAFNNSCIFFYDCFNNKEVKEFVNSKKGKTVKSITFYEARNYCKKITYNLQ
jgi:hypothetical protein